MSISNVQAPTAASVGYFGFNGVGSKSGAPTQPFDATPGSLQGGFGVPAPALPWSNQASQGTGSAASSGLLGNLTADIQALLIQSQSGGLTSGSASSAAATSATSATSTGTGSTSSSNNSPAAQLAGDIQKVISDIQSGTSVANPATQVASTNGTNSPNNVSQHHHHHHHYDGGNNGDASSISTASSSGTNTSQNGQGLAQTIAADVIQAIKSYSGGSSGNTASGTLA